MSYRLITATKVRNRLGLQEDEASDEIINEYIVDAQKDLRKDISIYVFDEWAANQDPYFKHKFYDEIIPQLKEAGKTVIVISHDEFYFDRADRILKLRDGRLVPESAPVN